MIPIYFEYHTNFLKARLLAPFSNRYKFAAALGKHKEYLRIIGTEILVTDDRKIVLVKNSKAGCTTAAHVLYQTMKGHPCEGDVHSPKHGLIQGFSHYDECISALKDPKTFKITTVRNPVDRAVSAFMDFVVERKNHLSDLHIVGLRHFGFTEDLPIEQKFDVFLKYLETSFQMNALYTDRHFRRQFYNIGQGKIKYDAICHVENMAEELPAALRKAGIPEDKLAAIDFGARNKTARKQKFQPDKTQLERLRWLYSIDFKKLGYEMPVK